MDYYKELSYYKIIEDSINEFGKSLEEKKSGCFHHRVESSLSVLIKSATNKKLIKNKVFSYVEQSSFNKEIKEYLKYFLSNIVNENLADKYIIPDSLKEVVKGNEDYDLSMIEGFKNLELSNKEFLIKESFEKFQQLLSKNGFDNVDVSGELQECFNSVFEDLKKEIELFKNGSVTEKEYKKYSKKKFSELLKTIEASMETKRKTKFTVFETIMKELNFVAWSFECQVSDVNYNSLPVIHLKGRYLPSVINVQSNIQMLKLQDYFQHYTERFERANDKTVLSNELVEIYKRAKQIISFYDENLHSNSDCVKSYFEKLPTDFKNKIDYNKKHTALIVVDDLQIFDIYFEVGDLTFNVKNKNYYDENRYTISYLTDNAELLRFCQKLIDFVGKFQVNLSEVLEPEKLEYLRRLCEISIEYSKDGSWSVGNLPIEFESITKVDLFIENFIKSIEILAKEGKDVHQLIDLFIHTTKTNLENPLLEKNVKTNRHLFNKLEGVKLLLQNVKALPLQEKQEAEPRISILKNDIESAFSFMQYNDPRKHKRILSDDDFESLINWVSSYFENDFTIPEIDTPIKIINTNKGNVVYTFIKIFKDLHPTKTRPESLFELIKLCFYDYRNDNVDNFKKQKEPQFYSQLVNKK